MYSIVIHSNTSADPPPIEPRLFFATIPRLRRSGTRIELRFAPGANGRLPAVVM
jgi:hypothetical protein